MRFVFFSCGAALIFCFGAATVDAQEWTRFRGPNGSGIGDADGLPAQFGSMDFEWILDLPGSGYSSPVLWGEKLFVTVLSESGKERRVLGVNSTNGQIAWTWTHEFEPHYKHDFNSFASSTPVVDDRAIYLAWTSGEETRAMALSHQGEEIWSCAWPGFSADHGSAASPILADGILIVHTDYKDQRRGMVYGVSPADGAELWRYERVTPAEDPKHMSVYSTPVVVEVGNRQTVALLSPNCGWVGLNPKNGGALWAYDGDYKFRSVGSPATDSGIVVGTMGSGGKGRDCTVFKPKPDGNVEVLYTLGISDGLSYVPSPVIFDGRVYFWGDGGVLTCRQLETGEKVFEARVGSGQFFSSPVLVDGKIYCGSRDGTMYVVAASNEFQLLGKNPLKGGIHATPAIANNRMFIRTDEHLMSLLGKKK